MFIGFVTAKIVSQNGDLLSINNKPESLYIKLKND